MILCNLASAFCFSLRDSCSASSSSTAWGVIRILASWSWSAANSFYEGEEPLWLTDGKTRIKICFLTSMLACSLLAWCTWASNFSLLSYVCVRVLCKSIAGCFRHEIDNGWCSLLTSIASCCVLNSSLVCSYSLCVLCVCVCVCVCAARIVWRSAAMEKQQNRSIPKEEHLRQFCHHFIFLSADLCHSTPHFLPRLLQLCRSKLIPPLQLDYVSLCWQLGSVRWRWSGDWGGGGGQDSTGVGDEGVDCGHSLHIPSSLERNKQQFS